MHDMPGTTRDAIDTVVETPDGPVRFIDTAGLRRPSKTERGARSSTRPCVPCAPSSGRTWPFW